MQAATQGVELGQLVPLFRTDPFVRGNMSVTDADAAGSFIKETPRPGAKRGRVDIDRPEAKTCSKFQPDRLYTYFPLS